MIKRIFCLISVFIIILSCSCITVNAETIEEELYIVDMTDEEIEELLSIQTYRTTSNTINIARWNKCIDNTQAEDYGYSVQYYCPNYNNVLYNQYVISYGQTGSAVGTRAYRLLYFNNDITWNAKYNNFKNGTIIMISSGNLEEIKNYLFSETYDRTAINATVMTSTDNSSWNWTNSYSQTYQFNNTNHSDTFYIYYKGTHETEPPYLKEDGTCYNHNYQNGICLVCGAEEPKNETGGLLSGIEDSLSVDFFNKVKNRIKEKLDNDKFYTELTAIPTELMSLFETNYNSKEEFNRINPMKITLRKTVIPTKDGQSYYYSNIDWGLQDVSVFNLDWFLGNHPYGIGVNIDGSPAAKKYSDTVIGAFLWVVFAFNLWKSLPGIISGEMSDVAAISEAANGSVSYTDTIDMETGEIKSKKYIHRKGR